MKKLKRSLIALAFSVCMVVPCVMYASAEDATEDTTTRTEGETVTLDGAKYVYYTNAKETRSEKKLVKTNRDGSTTNYYSAPQEMEGWLFAGWYTDVEGMVDDETPFTEVALSDEGSTVAWAKYVPSGILTVKAQVVGGTEYASETTSIRFVTSVDTLNYRTVGFDFLVFEQSNTKYGRETNTVYEKLYGLGSESKVMNYTPNYVFHSMSEYFMAYSFHNLANKDFGHGISARPYWITLDGTLVYGTESMKTVNQSYTGAMTRVTMQNVTSGDDNRIAHPNDSDWTNAPNTWVSKMVHSQGGCAYGDYYYQAVINRYPGADGNVLSGYTYTEEKNEVIIQRYKKNTEGEWTLDALSESMALCHANDITYNPNLTYTGQESKGLLIVSHNSGGTKYISFVDPNSLVLVSPSSILRANGQTFTLAVENQSYIRLPLKGDNLKGIYSIDYNAFTDRYVVGISGGQTYLILDSDFNIISDIYTQTLHKTTEYAHQGMVADDSFIYFVLFYDPDDGVTPAYKGHIITVYDWNGNAVTTIQIPSDSTGISTDVEPENIGIYNNAIYVSCANGATLSSTSWTEIYQVTSVTYSQEYEAFIDNTEGDAEYYFTLEDAVMNAEEGDTIQIMKDVTVDRPMPVLVNNVTITNMAGENVTITRGASFKNSMFDNAALEFTVQANSSGALKIDGDSVSGTSLIMNQADASLILRNVTISNVKTSGNGAVWNKGTLGIGLITVVVVLF